jgi:hypothetical protein
LKQYKSSEKMFKKISKRKTKVKLSDKVNCFICKLYNLWSYFKEGCLKSVC